MSDERKKPLWQWIVALLIGFPILYVASFGPACWWFSTQPISLPGAPPPIRNAPRLYWPIGWVESHGPRPLRRAIWNYATAGIPEGVILAIPISWDGTSAIRDDSAR